MIPNPIRKVLSTFQSCEARALLMGGQACVFYGGAEFSRDTDFAVLADTENLACFPFRIWSPPRKRSGTRTGR
jgi:hypothetical protein